MKYFGIGILAGFIALFGSLVVIGVGIARFAPDSMPAPAITKLVQLDETLRFIRRHPEIDPTILAVGSSVTWRQLAGKAFETIAGGPRHFLNGGTGHLQIHQTEAMANFYLNHFPNVRVLLVMVSLPDFENCTTEPKDMFDPTDAARYVFDDWPAAYFYFRYVSPRRYVRTAMTLAQRRTPFTGDLYIDAYGSGPLQVPEEEKRGLRYGGFRHDPACLAALERLVADTRARGVRLLLVFTPVHPDYRTRYPTDITWLTRVATHLEAEENRYGRTIDVLDMIRDPLFSRHDFFDAFHLQWKAVKVLSANIAASLDAKPQFQREGRIAQDMELRPGQRQQ